MLAGAALGLPAWAQSQAAPPADNAASAPAVSEIVVKGNYLNAVGSSNAASEGTVTSRLIQSRPTLRPAEVLEFVPGVIVSQHSGDGKANQYYLRGFNLDHGTDFATFVDGMPVNMPTHAHGQGYSDLNFLIPELVQAIHYRKGLYAAEDGDFSSAGTARIQLADQLPGGPQAGMGQLTVGERGYVRALVARNAELTTGKLLAAVESGHNDGPWTNPERFQRFNGLLRYSLAEGDTRQSLTLMAYTAKWDSTDQVPQRAVNSGQIGRFDAIDATDHGQTRRASLSWHALKVVDDGEWRANAYAISSHLDLFSNFTYFLENPVNGDQFQQAENRRVFGGSLSRMWQGTLAGRETRNTLGVQARHDRLSPVGLYTAEGGVRTGTTQESRVKETSIGLFGENELRWTPWLRSIAGLRTDRVNVDVNSNIAANSGQRSAWISSPKLSLIFGPWSQTEFFANTGWGFHSNDARGMTARITAKGGDPIASAVPLVRTKGSEVGLRTELIPGLQSSVALWQLRLNSELVFVGDAGETEASGASRRRGIEFNNHYLATPWLLLDGDVAFSQARFSTPQGEAPNMGTQVPGSVRTVVSLGATVTEFGRWFGQAQLRYFGPRPLTEDNSVRSKGTTLAYARLGYKLDAKTKVSLDVFNLFNRQASDIDYFYTSRLRGEPLEGVADVHSHPAEPRTVRLTLSMGF
ncbi:MAG: TonB-dependent receptor [Proteobacteria bacterium]|nr:TonB-dependent receptor [Pseudomonadota bacterium]